MSQTAEYVSMTGLLKSPLHHYSVSVCRYIMSVHRFAPFHTIMVGERPYKTMIHPNVSSAMSYDPTLSTPTPSTIGISQDVSSVTGCRADVVEEWFRDSWKYVSLGVLLVNATQTVQFQSSYSISETVPFQRWICSVINASVALGSNKVSIVSMGVPATNVMNTAINSLGTSRPKIKRFPYPNPAIISKSKDGDNGSHVRTFGNPSTSTFIRKIVFDSLERYKTTDVEFFTEQGFDMSHQISKVDDVISSSQDLVTLIDDAFKALELSGKMPTLLDAQKKFASSLIAYRDTVLTDIVSSSLQDIRSTSSMGKKTEWGGKRPWDKKPASVGTSSRMSVVTDSYVESVPQSFADDEEEVATVVEDVKPTPKKKTKKVVVRRVKKRISVVEETEPMVEITKGQAVDERMKETLNVVSYFITDNFEEEKSPLLIDIKESLSTMTVFSKDVASILSAAAKDHLSTGCTSASSLGYDKNPADTGSSLYMEVTKGLTL